MNTQRKESIELARDDRSIKEAILNKTITPEERMEASGLEATVYEPINFELQETLTETYQSL